VATPWARQRVMPPRRQRVCGCKDCGGQGCGRCDTCLEAKYDAQHAKDAAVTTPDPPWDPDHGWRVLDPDGKVVAAGPPTELKAVAEADGDS